METREELRDALEAMASRADRDAPDPVMLYQRAIGASQARRAVEGGPIVSAHFEHDHLPDGRRGRRRMMLAAALIVLVAGIAGVFAVLTSDDDEGGQVITEPPSTTLAVPTPTSTSLGEEQRESDATDDPEPEADGPAALGWTRQATSLAPRVAGRGLQMAATESTIYALDDMTDVLLWSEDGIAWAAVEAPTVDGVTAGWSGDGDAEGYGPAELAVDGETLYVAETAGGGFGRPAGLRIWRSDGDDDWSLTELPPIEAPAEVPVLSIVQTVSLAASPDVLFVDVRLEASVGWREVLSELENPPPAGADASPLDDGLGFVSGGAVVVVPWEELPPEALAAYNWWSDTQRRYYLVTADGEVTEVERPLGEFHHDVGWSGTRFFASSGGQVRFSTDGRTWSEPVDLPVPTRSGSVVMLGDTLVAVTDTSDGLLQSTDFGVTLEPIELDPPEVEGATADEPAWIIVPNSLSLQQGTLTAIAWRATPAPDGADGWAANGREGEWVLSSADGVTWTATQNQPQPPDRNRWPVFSMVNAEGEIVIIRDDATIDIRTPDTN